MGRQSPLRLPLGAHRYRARLHLAPVASMRPADFRRILPTEVHRIASKTSLARLILRECLADAARLAARICETTSPSFPEGRRLDGRREERLAKNWAVTGTSFCLSCRILFSPAGHASAARNAPRAALSARPSRKVQSANLVELPSLPSGATINVLAQGRLPFHLIDVKREVTCGPTTPRRVCPLLSSDSMLTNTVWAFFKARSRSLRASA
jgi:hypothetical protein